MLLGMVFRLGHCVRAIKEKGHDLLEEFLADIHGAMDPVARLTPIHLAHTDFKRLSFSAVAELDVEQIPAQDDSDPVKRVAVPSSGLSRRQTLPPDKVISPMVQDLLNPF